MSKSRKLRYQYVGASFKGYKVEELTEPAITSLLAWGYIVEQLDNKLVEESIDESNKH